MKASAKTQINPLALWIEASRPKTLLISVCPVLLGNVIAWQAGSFSWIIFLMTLLTSMGIQITTNFANDYFDFIKGADTTDRKGPRRVTQSGLVTINEIKKAVIWTAVITAILGSYLTYIGGPLIGLMLSASILIGIGYTGGPFPLAYLGLGEIFVILFFGIAATQGSYYLQLGNVRYEATWLGISYGLVPAAVLVVNNLRDIEEDWRSHKKTLCVRFGETFGRIEYTAFLVLACVIPCFVGCYFQLLTLLPAVAPLKAIWKNQSDRRALNVPFVQTAKLVLLYTLLLCASWIWWL